VSSKVNLLLSKVNIKGPNGGTHAAPTMLPGCGALPVPYLRLTDSCITQLKAQGPSRTCNESKEEEEVARACRFRVKREQLKRLLRESRGLNRVLPVVCVPCSLDSGSVSSALLYYSQAWIWLIHTCVGLWRSPPRYMTVWRCEVVTSRLIWEATRCLAHEKPPPPLGPT